jgi:hypothetical protein
MKKHLVLLLALAFLSQSCAKIFYTPDATSIAKAHKIIAIAPPKVSIAARKNVEASAIVEQQKTESINFQKEMYSWMLKRKMQGNISVEIQDVETTNAKLANAGYNEGKVFSPVEMCGILGVDGIMTSNYALTKPMSEGAAVAVALLVGVWGATNETTVSLSIHDQGTNKMIWNFDHKLSSSFGSPAGLVDALMRQASKKMPYYTSTSSY